MIVATLAFDPQLNWGFACITPFIANGIQPYRSNLAKCGN